MRGSCREFWSAFTSTLIVGSTLLLRCMSRCNACGLSRGKRSRRWWVRWNCVVWETGRWLLSETSRSNLHKLEGYVRETMALLSLLFHCFSTSFLHSANLLQDRGIIFVIFLEPCICSGHRFLVVLWILRWGWTFVWMFNKKLESTRISPVRYPLCAAVTYDWFKLSEGTAGLVQNQGGGIHRSQGGDKGSQAHVTYFEIIIAHASLEVLVLIFNALRRE